MHSSSDWTSICWKVLISSRFPRIRATSELLSLEGRDDSAGLVTCKEKGERCREAGLRRQTQSALLVSGLKSTQVVRQEALKVLGVFCLCF